MAGKPFKVGRFAHSLRVRLMREHLGVDVDALVEDDLMANEPVKPANEQDEWDPDDEQEHGDDEGVTRVTESERRTAFGNLAQVTGQGIGQGRRCPCAKWKTTLMCVIAIGAAVDIASELLRKEGTASNQVDNTTGDQTLDDERQTFSRSGHEEPGFTSSVVPTIEERTVMEKSPAFQQTDSVSRVL